MITITMNKDGFNVKGHAQYEGYGKDIVCASVSTIVQLAQMGLRVLAKQYPAHIMIIEEGENE